MTLGTEQSDALAFAQALLAADTQVGTNGTYGINGWWEWLAGVAFPYGILQFQGGRVITYPGAIQVGLNGLLTLKLVGLNNTYHTTLKPAYLRAHGVVQGQMGSNANVTIWGKFNREQVIDMVEETASGLVRHIGGIYRFQAT